MKVVRLASKVAVTPHSFSRFCLRSKQEAKAQPTAWLSRSPCKMTEAGQQGKEAGCYSGGVAQGKEGGAYRVSDSHEAVADPAACGPISADI